MQGKVKPCTAKSCGLYSILKSSLSQLLLKYESEARLFIGLDVSSVNAGLAVLQVVDGRVTCIESDVVSLKRASKDTDDSILEKRFAIMRDRFQQLHLKHRSHSRESTWEICVEDKIVRAGGAKGVIGSHTLAETLVAARLAASIEFPGVQVRTINPRSARAGLGLNPRFEASREETKKHVQAFVKVNFPGVQWTNKITDEDRADACIIALSALRLSLKRDLVADPGVRHHYSACHVSALGLAASQPLSPFQIRKRDELLSEALFERMQLWIDDTWLSESMREVSRKKSA
jgi:hypothetical protein